MVSDEARFEAIFRANYGAIVEYAARRVSDKTLAADIAAETFAVAWRRLEDVPEHPLPWLYGVARLTLANHRRTTRRQANVAEALVSSDRHFTASGERPIADQIAARDAVLEALTGLTDDDREIIRLAAWEELPAEDIAQAIGCARATVAVRLHRARRRLAKAMAHAGHVPTDEPAPLLAEETPRENR